MTERCHTNQGTWYTPEHLRDCSSSSCAGCKPCSEDHCDLRSHCPTHVNHTAGLWTCPSCIRRTSKDIATIVELETLGLHIEAVFAGVDSEAFNLIGPAADPDQYDTRRTYEDTARGWCEYPRQDDRHHPFTVLARWEARLRDLYGPPTNLFTNLIRAADYLTQLLAGPFPHEDQFPAFVKDIAGCRTHLETVVHDSRAPEEGRHCPRCTEATGKAPRLRKRYAQHPGIKPGQSCGVDGCKTCTGANDTWHCPDNTDHWWTEHDYRDRVATDYVEHATELPARELAERLGIPASTIRRWASRVWDRRAGEYVEPRLVSRRKGADGRKLYPVKDAMRLIEREQVGA
ncbi:MAG TPA: hypothetical protein VJL80_10020 [Aeromicrobium sp.]|nr:hypothetical protein [Aeromicrobium sp.]HKY58363.1 hypothetical protein [Aeromicrobium sp.]